VAVYHTSRPLAAQARPLTASQVRESVVFLPDKSTMATVPRSSFLTGQSRNAMRSPVGDTLGNPISPSVS
jgi:hypothetical protein